LKVQGYKKNNMLIFNTYLTKQKKFQILVEAQLGHKMNIKENLMILENIKILESFKIPKS